MPPRALIGVSIGTTTSCPSVSTTASAISPSVRPSTLRAVGVDEPRLHELPRDERDPAGRVDVRRDVAAERLQVGDDRRARRDRVEVVDREVDRELLRDRDEVQDAVRRAPGRSHRGGRVLEGRLRDDLRRPHVAAHEVDRESPRLGRGLLLRGVERRDVVAACGADAEELERRGHRVRGELAAAGAGRRARDRLQLVEVLGGDLPRCVRADLLVDVLDRDVASAPAARARSSPCRGRGPGCRAARAPSRRRGSSCRRRSGRRARRTGGRARRARSSRRSSRARRARRACRTSPSRRRPRRRSC